MAEQLDKQKLGKNLESFLINRPKLDDLEQRNIVKETKVAPTLVAKALELEKSQIKDKLEQKLERRLTKDELIKRKILTPEEEAAAAAAAAAGGGV